MKQYSKSIIPIFFTVIILLFTASRSSDFFAKLKSLSYILQLIDKYYVEEVALDDIIDGAIYGLLEELDPHSTYTPAKESESMLEQIEGEFEGIGIEFAILDGYITVIAPIAGTPSDRAGLVGGDKITKINEESAYKITQEEVFKKLRGPKGSSVVVTIQRVGLEDTFNVTLIRDKIPIHSVSAALIYKNDIGYIKINRFAKNTLQELETALDSLETIGMKNLILDLRNNGGGLMDQAISIVDLFVNSNDTILFTKGRMTGSNETFFATKNYYDKKYPVIALINRSSASASEIVSGALQDLDRGLVVGETSFGKGLVQRQFLLEDESVVRITIAKYYTPVGRMIQRSYKDGLDEYYLNLMQENREANDSLLNNRPVFKTKKGRTVYGGGGITPDIYIVDTAKFHQDTQALLSHPSRFAFKYAKHIQKDWENYSYHELNSTTYPKLKMEDFLSWVLTLDESLEVKAENIDSDWMFVENRIFANLSKVLWGADYYYHMLLNQDLQFQNAILNLDKAKNIIE